MGEPKKPLMLKKVGSMISKNVIIFFIIVAGLGTIVLVETDCPTCKGAGTIDMTQESDLKIVDFRFVDIYVSCPYLMSFIVDVSASNIAVNPVRDLLSVNVTDPKTGESLGEGYFPINMDANMSKDFTFYVSALEFKELDYTPNVSVNIASEEGEDVVCSTCEGKGKASLLMWSLIFTG